MKKLVTVEKFDIITAKTEYENKTSYGVLEEPAFTKLIDFIEELEGTDEHADANEFFKVYKPKNRSLGEHVVSVNNYVGLIQLSGGEQVQILPKIDFDEKRSSAFLKMLKSLRDFPGKNASLADLNAEKMNIYEVFINMYMQETRKLVKHGIKSAYIVQEDNLKFFKGKLLVSKQIKTNVAHG